MKRHITLYKESNNNSIAALPTPLGILELCFRLSHLSHLKEAMRTASLNRISLPVQIAPGAAISRWPSSTSAKRFETTFAERLRPGIFFSFGRIESRQHAIEIPEQIVTYH